MTVRGAALVLVLAATAGCVQVQALLGLGKRPAPARPDAAALHPLQRPSGAGGTLLLSGGGRTSGEIVAEAARLAGRPDARVLVIGFAPTKDESPAVAADEWRKAGFPSVELLDAADADHARRQLDDATFVWLTGGSQRKLLDELSSRGLVEPLRARFAAGTLVGGTGSGSAVVSELMLAVDSDAGAIEQKRVPTMGGLALWPGVIVDQRFVAKKRFARLTAAVIDHPEFIGIGIDDETGVVVTAGTSLRVVGNGEVVVLDARHAQVTSSRPGDASGATGVQMAVLSAGMTYDLAQR